MLFKASAPGSLMLLGEYAVLHGGYALVAAINRRITVNLALRTDDKITIQSALGSFEYRRHHCHPEERSDEGPPQSLRFVLTTLKKHQNLFSTGFDLTIESEFSDQVGFASSAAVTVATLRALYEWLGLAFDAHDFIKTAREIVQEVQGVGSGADVAACVLGGVVAYRAEPFYVEKIKYEHPFTVVYSGSKTKTVDAIYHVKEAFAKRPELFQKTLQAIDACAQAGIEAVKKNDHAAFGKNMDIQQGLMESLTVSTVAIDKIIKQLKQDSNILGAKISGSGLGDCVIGLGQEHHSELPALISVRIAQEGVRCEKI